MSFTAKYDGWCSGCGDRIYEGDEVTYEGQRVVHEDCGPDAEEEGLTLISRPKKDEHPGNPAQTFFD